MYLNVRVVQRSRTASRKSRSPSTISSSSSVHGVQADPEVHPIACSGAGPVGLLDLQTRQTVLATAGWSRDGTGNRARWDLQPSWYLQPREMVLATARWCLQPRDGACNRAMVARRCLQPWSWIGAACIRNYASLMKLRRCSKRHALTGTDWSIVGTRHFHLY